MKLNGNNMQIQNQTYTQPTFRGSVHWSLDRLVSVNVSKECNASIKYHLGRGEKPSKNVIKMMNRFGDMLINDLGEFMQKLHKNTVLKVVKGSERNYIAFRNPVTQKHFFLSKDKSGVLTVSDTPRGSIGSFSKEDSPFAILENVLDFHDEVLKMEPKKIDEYILSSAEKITFPKEASIIQKIKGYIHKNRIQKYKADIRNI